MAKASHSKAAPLAKPKMRWPLQDVPTQDLVIKRIAPEVSFKTKVYGILKQAVIGMDIYGSADQSWLDERQLSEKLGVSRTPVREAIAMLEQEGFVRSVPRKGIMVLKKTKREVIGMIEAWAALESMAARLLELGVYVVGFFFPVVPRGKARIRVQISAVHSRADLEFAAAAFAQAGRELGILREEAAA